MSALRETVAINVRHFRRSKSWTQAHLAERARCSQSTISAVEAGDLRPGLELLERVARSLGVETWQLFVAVSYQGNLRSLPPEIERYLVLRESADPRLAELGEELARVLEAHLRLIERSQLRRGRRPKRRN